MVVCGREASFRSYVDIGDRYNVHGPQISERFSTEDGGVASSLACISNLEIWAKKQKDTVVRCSERKQK
jgi:hypothetical protein